MYVVGHTSTRTEHSLLERALAILNMRNDDPDDHGDPARRETSWTTALRATGLAHVDPHEGATELLRMFNSQWPTGQLPLEVFGTGGTALTSTTAGLGAVATSTSALVTSGLVGPPIQASATLRVADSLGEDGHELLEILYPRLAAWHDYLLTSRVRNDLPIVEVWHPRETAMHDSPMWDEPLARAARRIRSRHACEELIHADTLLIQALRDEDFAPDDVRATTAFAVHDVLFNSLLVQAELDLGAIAQHLGDDGTRHILRSRRMATVMNRELFDPHEAWFVDRDVLSHRALPSASAAQLAPLYAGIPEPARAALQVDMWRALSAPASSPIAGMMASADPHSPAFSLTDGWRGPAWFSTNWLVHEGLRRYGYHADASHLRSSMLGVVARSGFWDSYEVFTGTGNGQPNAVVTAALALDLLASESLEPAAA